LFEVVPNFAAELVDDDYQADEEDDETDYGDDY